MLGGFDQHRGAGLGLRQQAQDDGGEQHPAHGHGADSWLGSPEP